MFIVLELPTDFDIVGWIKDQPNKEVDYDLTIAMASSIMLTSTKVKQTKVKPTGWKSGYFKRIQILEHSGIAFIGENKGGKTLIYEGARLPFKMLEIPMDILTASRVIVNFTDIDHLEWHEYDQDFIEDGYGTEIDDIVSNLYNIPDGQTGVLNMVKNELITELVKQNKHVTKEEFFDIFMNKLINSEYILSLGLDMSEIKRGNEISAMGLFERANKEGDYIPIMLELSDGLEMGLAVSASEYVEGATSYELNFTTGTLVVNNGEWSFHKPKAKVQAVRVGKK